MDIYDIFLIKTINKHTVKHKKTQTICFANRIILNKLRTLRHGRNGYVKNRLYLLQYLYLADEFYQRFKIYII